MPTSNNFESTGAPRTGQIGAPKPKGRLRWLVPTLAVVVAIGIGLFGGILIGKQSATSSQASTGFRGGAGGGFGGAAGSSTSQGGGGAAGGGITAGTVVSVNGDTVVIKTASGSDVTVTATSSTKVTKSSSSSVSALKAGETVTAIGQAGSSGGVTATTITEGSTGFGGFGGGGGRPGGATNG